MPSKCHGMAEDHEQASMSFISSLEIRLTTMAKQENRSRPTSREPGQKQANLCVKVPLELRQWWSAHSKLQGITLTEVIIEALTERFGKPGGQ